MHQLKWGLSSQVPLPVLARVLSPRLRGPAVVKFNYKTEDPKNVHAGFVAEDVPELVATSNRKGVSIMDLVAIVTQVVKEQQKTIKTPFSNNSILAITATCLIHLNDKNMMQWRQFKRPRDWPPERTSDTPYAQHRLYRTPILAIVDGPINFIQRIELNQLIERKTALQIEIDKPRNKELRNAFAFDNTADFSTGRHKMNDIERNLGSNWRSS